MTLNEYLDHDGNRCRFQWADVAAAELYVAVAVAVVGVAAAAGKNGVALVVVVVAAVNCYFGAPIFPRRKCWHFQAPWDGSIRWLVHWCGSG